MRYRSWFVLFFLVTSFQTHTALHRAARDGRIDDVQRLVNQGHWVVFRKDAEDLTPLHHAAEQGHIGAACVLLHAGAAVNALQVRHDVTPLHKAAAGGHAGVVRLLLDCGADVNHRNLSKELPLHLAAYGGHVGVVDMLLRAGSDARNVDGCRHTVLDVASARGHTKLVKYLLKHDGVIRELDEGSWPHLLRVAAAGNHVDVMRLLADAGAMKYVLREGRARTILDEAVYRRSANAVRFLLQYDGIPINTKYDPPLHLAVGRGGAEVTWLLLQAGADTEVLGTYGLGCTPLHIAVQEGRLAVLRTLLGAGANVNAQDPDGGTALLKAVARGYSKMARALLRAGADPTIVTKNAFSVLPYAVQRCDPDVAQTILDMAGVDVDAWDAYGETALHRAAERGCLALVARLLERGATVDVDGEGCCRLLRCAVREGRVQITRFLLGAGVEVSKKELLCLLREAIRDARKRDREALIWLLAAFGAEPDIDDRYDTLTGSKVQWLKQHKHEYEQLITGWLQEHDLSTDLIRFFFQQIIGLPNFESWSWAKALRRYEADQELRR